MSTNVLGSRLRYAGICSQSDAAFPFIPALSFGKRIPRGDRPHFETLTPLTGPGSPLSPSEGAGNVPYLLGRTPEAQESPGKSRFAAYLWPQPQTSSGIPAADCAIRKCTCLGHFRRIPALAPVSSHPFCGTLPAPSEGERARERGPFKEPRFAETELSTSLGSPETCRRFPPSPSEGERDGD